MNLIDDLKQESVEMYSDCVAMGKRKNKIKNNKKCKVNTSNCTKTPILSLMQTPKNKTGSKVYQTRWEVRKRFCRLVLKISKTVKHISMNEQKMKLDTLKESFAFNKLHLKQVHAKGFKCRNDARGGKQYDVWVE